MRRNGEGPCPWYPNMPAAEEASAGPEGPHPLGPGGQGPLLAGSREGRDPPPAGPRGAGTPNPLGPGGALTLPEGQLHGQHGRPRELLPPALVPADGHVQLLLQTTQVLRPEAWGWGDRSEVQGPPVARERDLAGLGHSPGGAGV